MVLAEQFVLYLNVKGYEKASYHVGGKEVRGYEELARMFFAAAEKNRGSAMFRFGFLTYWHG